MKKHLVLLPLAFIVTSCAELQQLMTDIPQIEQHQTIQQQNVKHLNGNHSNGNHSNGNHPNGNQVIRVKKRPNDGKQVVKDGITYPEQFSLDENGNLEFTPTISDKTIREWNRITEKSGITIQGY